MGYPNLKTEYFDDDWLSESFRTGQQQAAVQAQAQPQQAPSRIDPVVSYPSTIDRDDELRDVANQVARERGLSFQMKYWLVLMALCLLPLAKSMLLNVYHLGQNIYDNIQLSHQKSALEAEKSDLESKLKVFGSKSGLKRLIKEETNLLESNEILIKINQE